MEHKTTIIAAIVALVFILAAAAIGLSIVGTESDSTPLVASLVGIIAPTVVALLALLRGEATHTKIDEVHDQVNGRMTALEQKVDDSAPPAQPQT